MSIIENLLIQYDRALFSTKDKVFFLREIAYLLEGGVSITQAVEVIQESSQKVSVMMICTAMKQGLHQGKTLSAVMRTLPEYFNEGDANIVSSGEGSGELTHVLQYLAQEYEYLHMIKNKYTTALMYPAFLFSIALVAIYLLFTNVLPGIFLMVEQFDVAQIPPVTKFLMVITEYLSQHGSRLIIGILLALASIMVVMTTNKGKRRLYEISFRLPLVGRMIQYYTLIKCLRYMKLLLYSGMHYADVFVYLRNIMENTAYKEPLEAVIDALQVGEGIAETLQHYPEKIPKDVVTLIKVGEETASLPRSLENASTMYEGEFQKIIDGLSKVIEPLLIVLVGGIIAITALSVFGIIGSMVDSIQGGF